MKHAQQTDGEKKQSVIGKILRVISVAIFVGVLGAGCIYLMKKRDVQIDEEEPVKVLSEEEQLLEFEEYLKENEDVLQRFTEWSAESILEKEEYTIIFNERWYRSCLEQYEEWGRITILYSDGKFEAEEHEEIEKTLNEDKGLMEALNSIKENGIITSVQQGNLDESKQVMVFTMDVHFAPSITIDSSYDSATLFWSDDKDCEEYGYENIEGNWYKYVGLSQEQLLKELEKEYVEFEKMFWGNKNEMQNFIDAFQESETEEKEYNIVFDINEYTSELSRNKPFDYLSVYFGEDFFSVEEDREVENTFDENSDLIDATKTIKEKGMITRISIFYKAETIRIVEFWVDAKYTPFVTTNNGVENGFAWCDDEECERYGYKNVEGNWYMHIQAAPE